MVEPSALDVQVKLTRIFCKEWNPEMKKFSSRSSYRIYIGRKFIELFIGATNTYEL